MDFLPIVLPDGQTTPVNQTFSPESNLVGIAKWVNRASGVAVGFPAITQSLRVPNKDTANYRFESKIVLPVLEVTTPSSGSGYVAAPALAYSLILNLSLSLPSRSTMAQRKDLVAFIQSYVLTDEFTKAVEDYETVF